MEEETISHTEYPRNIEISECKKLRESNIITNFDILNKKRDALFFEYRCLGTTKFFINHNFLLQVTVTLLTGIQDMKLLPVTELANIEEYNL